ncbi:Zinc finger BED domain-containing protein 4-like Protein [Tribolium castaneum]|nr:Zinc finger BED domain-containing protein 4-like Protein [Tribolium castaneum]
MGCHTFEKIAEILDDTHSKFNLGSGKLLATVSDNGSNFVKAFKEFGLQLRMNEEDEDGENEDLEFETISENLKAMEMESDITISLPKHIRASHTLNLIATTDIKNTILKDITLRTRHTNILAKCNSLWKMASRPKSAEIIQEILGHTLSYPGPTRWNSLYDALTQILQEKDHLLELFEKLGIKTQMLKDTEIAILTDYCQILKPLANSIDILQGEKNTFFGYLMPTLGSLFKKMERLSNTLETSNVAYKILKACQEALLKRFQVFFDFSKAEAKEAIVASFTLPKFKLRWVKAFESFYKEADFGDINSYVHKLVVEAAEKIEVTKSVSMTDIENNTVMDMTDEFFELDRSNSPESLKSCNKRKFELEILQYAEDTSIDLKSLNRFPVIQELFLKYNTCLPSSAPVERLFSFAEIVNAPRRHALSDQHFEQLVILKSNGKRLL